MPRSVNEQLFDRSVRHATFLARLSNAEAAKIVKFLEREVHPDLVVRIRNRLERANISGKPNLRATKRLRDLQKDIETIIREGHQEAYRVASASLRDAAVAEGRMTVRILDDILEPFLIVSNQPSVPILRSIVSGTMVRGEFLRDDFAAMTARTRRGVVSAINIGLAEGDSVDEIVRRVRGSRTTRGVLAASKVDARRIVRTAATHVTAHARDLTFRENASILKGTGWLSTLDSRTSLICISLDGQVFPVDSGPRPPAHGNCRSSTYPVVRSYKELGLDIPDLPPSTRASMNGQVPGATTYPKWLKTQSTAVQNEVLGPRLAKHWRAGRISVDKFIDSNNRPLSIGEILRLEGLD